MAEAYIKLEKYNKGLELLKQNNPCRVNHSVIGYTLAADCNDPDGALPYLSFALLETTRTHMKLVLGYLNVYFKKEKYDEALAMADWALAFYLGLRDGEKQSYIDKSKATLCMLSANILLCLNRREDAESSLHRAKSIALQFDKAPDYDASRLRFVSGSKSATAFDDMGDTAMFSLDGVAAQIDEPKLTALWRTVKDKA